MPTVRTTGRYDEALERIVSVTSPDFSEEIARGVAFLDEVQPGWISEINPNILRLNSTFDCVLGQTFAAQYDGGISELHKLFPDVTHHDVYFGYAVDFGFNYPSHGSLEGLSEDVPDEDMLRWTAAADELLEWGKGYVAQGADYHAEEVDSYDATRVIWSALTEQWIRTVNDLKKARDLDAQAA